MLIMVSVLAIVLLVCMEYFDNQVKNDKALATFSSDIEYPVADTIKPIFVENTNQCHPNSLQTCTVGDASTCMSCDTFSQCVEFHEDATAIQIDGTTTKIPKTETGKGWCLPIINQNVPCNQFHGRKVLQQNANHEWVLKCECLRPGYIGNDDFSLSCETANVCNGDVVMPLGPWETVTCNCPPGSTPTRLNDVPTCVKETIVQHKYTALATKTVDAKLFDATYSHNIDSTKLPNPCTICPITGVTVNGELKIVNDNEAYCVGNDASCLAIRLQPPDTLSGTNTRVLNGKEGPDAVIALKWKQLIMYGTETSKMQYVVLFDTIDNDDLASYLQLPEASTWAINLSSSRFPEHFISNVKIPTVPVSTCVDAGFPIGFCGLHDATPDKSIVIDTVTINKKDPVEKPIIWGGGDAWDVWEKWNPIAGLEAGNDKADRIVLNKRLHEINRWTSHVKVLYLVYDAELNQFTYIRTNDVDDWKKYIGAV